jgi:hypothetical protein
MLGLHVYINNQTGFDIIVYPTFKVTKVAEVKCKYREDYDPTFSN